jgi:aryl-phospho-beta-D-glucosidase BglC (GH1 family)
MPIDNRRSFLTTSGKLILGTVALGSLAAHAEEHGHEHGDPGDGQPIPASAENRCATCQFWGGMRKLAEDNKEVIAQSMGWCNNPDSPNHGKLTKPDHEMKKAGIWKRWGAI